MIDRLQLIALPQIPLIQPDDDLAVLIFSACQKAHISLRNDDIVVIAQKVVSKAEGCFVRMTDVSPSARALELAGITGKAATVVEVILWDTAEIIRVRQDLLIVLHKLGFICANAGIDRSNVSSNGDFLLRLPADPDGSARTIRRRLAELSGINPPVLIIDSHGRPWRLGAIGVTIGLSGLSPVQYLRGQPDLFGIPLEYTQVGFADQIASAASLLMGQADEGCPVVIVRGLPFSPDDKAVATDIIRPAEIDMFR